jgi:hypothetical protein
MADLLKSWEACGNASIIKLMLAFHFFTNFNRRNIIMRKLLILTIIMGILTIGINEVFAIDCDDMEAERLRLEQIVRDMNNRLLSNPSDSAARKTMLDTIARLKAQVDDLQECSRQGGDVWEQMTRDFLCALTQGHGSSCPKPIRDICDDWETTRIDDHWARVNKCGDIKFIPRLSPDQCTDDYYWTDEDGRFYDANECIKKCETERWLYWPITKTGEVWMSQFQECAKDISIIRGNERRAKVAGLVLMILVPIVFIVLLVLMIRKSVRGKLIAAYLILAGLPMGLLWLISFLFFRGV